MAGICFCISNLVYAQNNTTKIFETSLAQFRVVLDPGHGGKDSVTRAEGFYEKNIVLAIAKEIKKALIENGFEVSMTRQEDVFIPLSERSAMAGDAFISLHVNSVADSIGPSVRSMIKGMEIYTENDMANSGLVKRSQQLAICFKQQLSNLNGINVRPGKQKSLAVLNKSVSPSILLELGFLSNKEDLSYLTTSENYKYIATAFVNALKVYRRNINSKH